MPHHYSSGSYTTPNGRETSKITVLIYLNDGYNGGETVFISPKDHNERVPYVPTAGSVLMFEHRLLHEGAELVEGQKFLIRTEVMYKLQH